MGRTGAFAGLIAAFVLLPSALPAQPAGPGLSTYLASWAVIDEQGGFNQSYIAYWSDPRDVRRHKDGAFYGVMGGAHQLLYIETNFVPGDHYFVDPAARGNFSRDGGGDGRRGGVFAAPRAFGEVVGGTIYGDVIVFTRDGRSALEPAPLGPLLGSESARLRKAVADMDAADARAAAGAARAALKILLSTTDGLAIGAWRLAFS